MNTNSTQRSWVLCDMMQPIVTWPFKAADITTLVKHAAAFSFRGQIGEQSCQIAMQQGCKPYSALRMARATAEEQTCNKQQQALLTTAKSR